MPIPLKALISLVVAGGGALALHFERAAGSAHVGWAAVALAGLMIFGVWLFPDTRRGD